MDSQEFKDTEESIKLLCAEMMIDHQRALSGLITTVITNLIGRDVTPLDLAKVAIAQRDLLQVRYVLFYDGYRLGDITLEDKSYLFTPDFLPMKNVEVPHSLDRLAEDWWDNWHRGQEMIKEGNRLVWESIENKPKNDE